MKYKVYTLGCKVNQVETQALELLLAENGLRPAAEDEIADLIIVNTCAVTAESGRKSRQALRRLKNENPGAVTAVCGCFSQLSSEEIQAIGADVVHGSGNKERFCADILCALSEKQEANYIDDPFSRRIFEELPGGAVSGRTRSMLKIQDGCVNFCSYCIIPYTRGRVRSLPPESCAKQASEMAKQGFSELVVTGIEIASYGVDLEPRSTLTEAVTCISAASGDMRIRLGSLEPTVITEDFCRAIAATGKVCDHFHLSLQSGCDKTLAVMNRKYNTGRFFEAVTLLRRFFPGCGLTADLIVGFPGESRADHEESLSFIEKCGFSSMHIFPFSPRPGTKAAAMNGQISNSEKAERAREAQKLAEKMENDFLNGCIGRILPVIFESEQDGMSVGHASNYAQVYVSGGQMRGLVQNVKIEQVSGKMLVGNMI